MYKRSNVFTLIELIIVISIIVILMSILLPALKKAMETSKRIACIANQKQIFLSWQLYAYDYNYHSIPMGGTYSHWQCTLLKNGYVSGCWASSDYNTSPDQVAGIYKCPSENRQTVNGATGWNTWKGCHYGINMNLLRNLPTIGQRQWEIVSKIKTPSAVCLFADKEPRPNGDFSRIWYCYGSFRHSNGWNVAYLDGHANWLNIRNTPCLSNAADSYQDIFWADFRYWK